MTPKEALLPTNGALVPVPFHFRTGFAASTLRSSRDDPVAALLAANAMAWFVVASLALTAGAPLRQEARAAFGDI